MVPDPAPDLDLATAAELAARHFEVEVSGIRELGSHQDRNFAVSSAGRTLVLKVAHAGQSLPALAAQDLAMEHLAGKPPLGPVGPLQTPRALRTRTGADVELVELAGRRHALRLLTYVPGLAMTDFGYLNPAAALAFGQAAGAITAALAGMDHPGAHEPSQWDVAHAPQVVAELAPALADPGLRDRVARASDAARAALVALPELPAQLIHGDLTDFNVVAELAADRSPRPCGVIDFGDLVHSWRVGELAITACSLLGKDPADPLRVAGDVATGFTAACPLADHEVRALWPLIVLRSCAGLVSTAAQLRHEPDNPYLHENLAVDRAVFDLATSLPVPVGTTYLALRLGVADERNGVWPSDPIPLSRLFPGADLPAARWQRVDLAPASSLLDEGAWLDPGLLRDRVVGLLAGDPGYVPHGQAQPHRAPLPQGTPPASIHLGVDLVVPAGTDVAAPWDGEVLPLAGPGESGVAHRGGLVLRAAGRPDLLLAGLRPAPAPGPAVTAGQWLGRVAGPGPIATPAAGTGEPTLIGCDPALPAHLHLALGDPGIVPPTNTTPGLAPAWQEHCPDPAPLLGLPPALRPPDPRELLAARRAVLADVQKTYFADPPEMVRGWRHLLVAGDGRVYLDGVNNVAVLGHSHPGVAEAVTTALRTLNTNSRFNLRQPVEFAAALRATLPARLARVFLVSSGSEAVDLALRLARVHTGRRDVIALRTAYHGWTTASDEVSSALMDNPRALETRPDWIHLAEPPNLYRGRFTGPDSGPAYADDVRSILTTMAGSGRAPAAYISETLNGNAGGIELPEGYLAEVYRDVRAAGGLAIADEVQVGYGRLGSHFWGFQAAGVVPDIVCLAKATGNGFPVAAVACTEEVAASFAGEGSFFASMGGTPAGAAAALATLVAIGAEDLMGNAARMGARLRAGLEGLVAEQDLAGAVHGRGLYLGLELVSDPGSKEPATSATDALCERLLRMGVVMAATGDHMNVLKIKPPLCIDAVGVDHLLEALSEAFRTGW